MRTLKPGYRTTEFWISVFVIAASNIITLYFKQEVPDSTADAVITITSAAINAINAIVYIYHRSVLKSQHMDQKTK